MTNQPKPVRPCPVCGRDHDDDCRIYSDGLTVLCYTRGQGGTGNVPCPPDEVNGYRFIGLTDDKRCGKYVPALEQETTWKKPEKKDIKSPKHSYFNYPLNAQPFIRVCRIDYPDKPKDIYQQYYDQATGKWINKIPAEAKRQVPLYPGKGNRLAKATAGVFLVEGEGVADELNQILPKEWAATSLIGGSGNLKAYNPDTLEALAHLPVVVLSPDADLKGMKHMEEVEGALHTLKPELPIKWAYAPVKGVNWFNLPKDGGADLKDWLEQQKVLVMTEPQKVAEMLIGMGGEKRQLPETLTEKRTDSATVTNKHEQKRQALSKATQLAKDVIERFLDLVEESTELEAIRSAFEIAPTTWDKHIKLIRKESHPDRLDAMINDFVDTKDPAEKLNKKRIISTYFQISKHELDEIVRVKITKRNKDKRQMKIMPLSEAGRMCINDNEEWIYPTLIPGSGDCILLTALPGVGKTKFAIDVVASLIMGKPLLGIDPIRKDSKCIFCSSDQSLLKTVSYLEARGIDCLSGEYDDRLRINGGHAENSAWTMEYFAEMREQIQEFKPDLVVIDSLRSAVIQPLGLDENTVEVGKWIRDIANLGVELGCTIILIHHSNKNGIDGVAQASGNTIISGTVDTVISISKPQSNSKANEEEENPLEDSPKRIIKVEKSRNNNGNLVFHSIMSDITGRFELDGPSKTANEQNKSLADHIVAILNSRPGKRLETEEIHDLVGGNLSTLKKTLSKIAGSRIRVERHPKSFRRKRYSSFMEQKQPNAKKYEIVVENGEEFEVEAS